MTTSGTPEPGGSADADLYHAVLDNRKIAFFDPAHAQALAEQWNSVHADDIARIRAEVGPEAAQRRAGHVESCAREHWLRNGPGGMASVWTRVPASAQQHSLWANFTGFAHRHTTATGGPLHRTVWEFQSWFTTLPVRKRIEFRPRGVINVQVEGTDEQAVDEAFTEAFTHVMANPNTGDHLHPAGVLQVLRGLAEGDGQRYAPWEEGFHTDVRAAIACGLVDESAPPGARLRLTSAGSSFTEQHGLLQVPDPAEWDAPPELAAAADELATLYSAAPQQR
ncbi:hypothetical protein [Streptomyces sp. MMBL 11-1]|uniref:hypothetical protein n=1 Tax=Streptomyces sp. MMBL 11-1 TaxID=3026420 RepID=UPI00235EEACC|nr:hypothetical protein [Streptomyces sp. MMBL 11-1]